MAVGKKTGGRQKGVLNRKTAEKVSAIEASGLTPLDFMLSVLRSAESDMTAKMWAAKEAAPYVHPRLAAIDHTVKTRSVREMTDDELRIIAAGGSPRTAPAEFDPKKLN